MYELTPCNTEQLWQAPTVASAAIRAALDWVSPGIMVTASELIQIQYKNKCWRFPKAFALIEFHRDAVNNTAPYVFASPTFTEDPY